MTLKNLYKLLILLPVGACISEDIADEVELAQSEDDVNGDPDTRAALSPALAESARTLPGALPPAEPPVPDGTPAPAADADMVWNGSRWFAVWTDRRNGDADIRGALVSADGEVSPPDGELLISGEGDQKSPQIAFNSGRYLVVYTDTGSGANHVRATRIGLDGLVQDAGGFTLSGALATGQSPAVACNGTSFFAVYESGGSVYGQFVSSGGMAGPARLLAAQSMAPRIAFNGNDYLVVYNSIGTDLDVSARIIHGDATPGPVTVVSAAAGYQEQPEVAASGSRFLIAWRQEGALVATQFDAQGMQPAVLARSIVGRPALAGSEHAFAISWSQVAVDELQVVGMALGTQMEIVSRWISVRLPLASDDEIDDKRPAVAFEGAGEYAMVTWQDHADNSGATTIWARPTLNQEPFLVSAMPE